MNNEEAANRGKLQSRHASKIVKLQKNETERESRKNYLLT